MRLISRLPRNTTFSSVGKVGTRNLCTCHNTDLKVATTPASLLVPDVADLVMRLHEIVVRQHVCGKNNGASSAAKKCLGTLGRKLTRVGRGPEWAHLERFDFFTRVKKKSICN